jgi:PPP family 3-phenylpropionic acid transporter
LKKKEFKSKVESCERMTRIKMSVYFYLLFFGFGVLYPMLGIYFDEVGLTGAQIGFIMSVGPVISIFSQPLWGVISDRFQNPRFLLTMATFFAGISVLGFVFIQEYYLLVMMMGIFSIFQSGVVPISDSLTISYVKREGGEYGTIRLWGAVGFAMAVWIAGMVIEATFSASIFYMFAVTFMIGTWFAKQMPEEADSIHVDIRAGLAKLLRIPTFILLLISCFLVLGSIQANNFYFGIYYTSIGIGGTVAGVGLVFLFAAGSEAPFMKLAGFFIKRFGLVQVMILASILSASRWFFFYTEPSTLLIFLVSILQGISIGLFIPAGVELVRQLTPEDVKITGMSFYSMVGNGLGTMFATFVGGLIFDYYSIAHTYLFFGIATLLGTIALVGLLLIHKKSLCTAN